MRAHLPWLIEMTATVLFITIYAVRATVRYVKEEA